MLYLEDMSPARTERYVRAGIRYTLPAMLRIALQAGTSA